MNDAIWSDRELRSFITRLRDRDFDALTDAPERDRFLRQAEVRVAPEARRRLLARIGAATDATGLATVAFEILEQEIWGKRHTWLMVTTDPWNFLTDLVVEEVGAAYRSAVHARSDSKKLKGIAKASTRAELPARRGESSLDDSSASDGGAAEFDDCDDNEPDGDGIERTA